MEEQGKQIDLVALIRAVWTRRKKIFLWAVVGLGFGVMVSLSIPKEYTALVKIVPEGSSTGSGALSSMSGLAAMMGVNVPAGGSKVGIGENAYPEIMRSSPFLAEFATIRVPYKRDTITLEYYLNEEQKQSWWSYVLGLPGKMAGWAFSSSADNEASEEVYSVMNPSARQRMFELSLSGRIAIEKDIKTGVYDLSAKMQDPLIAAVVADSLTTKLQRYMFGYFTSKARKDLESSEEQLLAARKAYYYADSVYAAAVDKNQNLVSKSAQVKLDRLQNERNLANSVYQQLATQVEMNKLKLQEDTPIATVIEPSRIPDRATSPRRLLIVLVCTFLGALAVAGSVAIKYTLIKKQ